MLLRKPFSLQVHAQRIACPYEARVSDTKCVECPAGSGTFRFGQTECVRCEEMLGDDVWGAQVYQLICGDSLRFSRVERFNKLGLNQTPKYTPVSKKEEDPNSLFYLLAALVFSLLLIIYGYFYQRQRQRRQIRARVEDDFTNLKYVPQEVRQ